MQIRHAITLDNNDAAQRRKMAEAFNLVGGQHTKPMVEKRGKMLPDPSFKPFTMIEVNDFTWDDVMIALKYIKLRRVEIELWPRSSMACRCSRRG